MLHAMEDWVDAGARAFVTGIRAGETPLLCRPSSASTPGRLHPIARGPLAKLLNIPAGSLLRITAGFGLLLSTAREN